MVTTLEIDVPEETPDETEPDTMPSDGVVKEPIDGLDPQHELAALRNFHRHVTAATREIEQAKIAASEAGKLVKELRESLEDYVEVHQNLKIDAETHPLLFAGQEQDNWRDKPLDLLAVTEKDKEKLFRAGFVSCGEISDWLSQDWVEKRQGCNGKAFQERIGEAINKISGAETALKGLTKEENE